MHAKGNVVASNLTWSVYFPTGLATRFTLPRAEHVFNNCKNAREDISSTESVTVIQIILKIK